MRLVTARPWLAAALLLLASCDKKAPTAPTVPEAPTRIIVLSGDLSFGNVEVGNTWSRTLHVSNAGTAALTVTGINGPFSEAFTASPLTGSIQPGGPSMDILINFKPLEAKSYSGTLTVQSNATSGGASWPFTATGIRTAPTWVRSGFGNQVFDMPAYVARVRIRGHFVDSYLANSNFIVSLAGRSLVNEILRAKDYDGTHLTTGGGVVAITNSSAIQWSFEEQR